MKSTLQDNGAPRSRGLLGILKINRASTKGQPSILVMGLINFLQLACLTCGTLLLADQVVNGPERIKLIISTIAAAAGIVMWFMTTTVGAVQYHRQLQAKRSIDELLGMTEALQSAESYEDTATVLKATSLELLPDLAGALYVFNNSRDRLDLAGAWNFPEDDLACETLSPNNCWALKRGKIQINRATTTKLRCTHHSSSAATLEVPMIARGAVYGLLIFSSEDRLDGAAKFGKATRDAQAMADAMSLALSNIALREKLRTQSLRDPLTGLFNRRYMEDALERYISLSERNGSPVSVLMLDLDNFKRLNDEHGHAKGDAVLRDVAAQVLGSLKPSDVACRYGGEEIIAILPDCSLEDAALKAEAVRLGIEALSDVHGTPISASIGLSSLPETSNASNLVSTADKALYAAKSGGKNRVVGALSHFEANGRQRRCSVAG